MPLYPRIPLPSVGTFRFRDTLRKDGKQYKAPLYTWIHSGSGKKITVGTAHILGGVSYYKRLEELMSEHEIVGHAGQLVSDEPVSPGIANPSGSSISIPTTWSQYTTPMYGIDTQIGHTVTDMSTIFWGLLMPNPRGVAQFNNTIELLEKHNKHTIMVTIYAAQIPTFCKRLQDSGYELHIENEEVVVDEDSTEPESEKLLPFAKISTINYYSNDFLPSILVLLYITYVSLIPKKKEPQLETYGGYAPQGGYPPQQYQQPYSGGYPPQYSAPPGAPTSTGYQAAPVPVGYMYPPQPMYQQGYPPQQQAYPQIVESQQSMEMQQQQQPQQQQQQQEQQQQEQPRNGF